GAVLHTARLVVRRGGVCVLRGVDALDGDDLVAANVLGIWAAAGLVGSVDAALARPKVSVGRSARGATRLATVVGLAGARGASGNGTERGTVRHWHLRPL